MKKNILFFLAFISINLIKAQPSIQWQKCLGGSADDLSESIQQTFDGGYIVAGFAVSNNGNVTGNHGSEDFWIVKLDSIGIIQWQKCLGGSGNDESYYIRQTADSGYVVAGFTASNDSNVSGNHGSEDFWIVKLNSTGSIQWQKCLGGSAVDDAFSIQQTTDGGYVVAGGAQSNDGNVTGNHGGYDFWIVKLNSIGTIQWQKSFGGSSDDIASVIQQTTDGGYIVSGSAMSNDGDVTGNHGNWDYWVVKLDSTGILQWQKCLGGSDEDIGYPIQQTFDGGYIVTGFTKSNNGDVSGNHGSTSQTDYWVVKLTNTGTIQWQKCLGGSNDDKAYSIQQTTDSCYVVAGYTTSNNGNVFGNNGGYDFWLVKLTNTGTIQWQKCLGGSGDDWARSIQQTTDGGYVVTGWVASNNGNVSGNHGNNDYWIVKLNPSAPSDAIPVANFYTFTRIACIGAPITFSDSSTNTRPTSWNWNFPGGTLTGGTTLTDSMPQVTYNTTGTYAVSFTASTSAGSNSITKNAYITISSNLAQYNTNTAFAEGFETVSVPGIDWSISSSTGTNWMLTSTAAATGTKSIMINNISNTAGDISTLIGPTINLSAIGSPVLAFSMAYQQNATTNNDKLQVYVSTDCGGTWVSKWGRVGTALQPSTVIGQSTSPFVPSASQFTTYTVNINSVASSTNAMFKWVFYAGTSVGNNIYLDDINIYNSITGIKIFQSGADLNIYPNPAQNNFTVEVSNNDKQTLSVFDINGKLILSQTIYSTTSIDASTFNAGVYSLNITSTQGTLTKKLVIVK